MSQTMPLDAVKPLSRQDFVSDQVVRWCPGCGDYAVLAAVQKVMPDLGIPKEKIVFISGIGCSSRFPYYMNTYGVHSIHGRAPTLATGLALANPDLTIFVVTGDGDGLSIGGNHLLHALRRNVNINILLFNNRIYGLTKGQYSPTSLPGHKTKSSPMGTVEQSLNPISIAIGSEASFVARSVDVQGQHLGEIIRAAVEHRGSSFVEIYQNCNIFNDKAWESVTEKDRRDENQLVLRHGQPMTFAGGAKGIRLNGLTPEIVDVAEVGLDQVLVHDAHRQDPSFAFMLSRMTYPHYPVPMGILRSVETPEYAASVMGQVAAARAARGEGDLNKLFASSETWTVAPR